MKERHDNPGYYVPATGWPGGRSPDDPTIEEVYEVLKEFDTYYPLAVESLKKVVVPPPDDPQGVTGPYSQDK